MIHIAKKFGEYLLLFSVTVIACGVMWWVSQKNTTVHSEEDSAVSAPCLAARPKALVAVESIRPELTDLTVKYSGKFRPWETYSLGFEVGGRVQALGEDGRGQLLDDGMAVHAGQLLARLDDRIYRAQRAEATAQLEQATSDLRRAQAAREQSRSAITDAEHQEYLTELALAKARQEIATKNLDDTVLVSPVDGVISRRKIEAGESVSPNETVFEIVQNQDVLLVVEVPEARIRELEMRMRAVREAQTRGDVNDPESVVFRARVALEGKDVFGVRWPTIEAEVYRIAQVSDPRTGLFEVEIRVPNAEGLLRPGMVATAQIVTDRILAYQAPESAVTFRGRNAHLFTLDSTSGDVQAMFFKVGETSLFTARRVDLMNWIDQGDRIVIPASDYDFGPIVVRGQQRLTNAQQVRIVNPESLVTAEKVPNLSSPNEATARRPEVRAEVN